MTAYDARARPRSLHEVHDVLARFSALPVPAFGEPRASAASSSAPDAAAPLSARQPPLRPTLGKGERQRPVGYRALAALALVVLALAVGLWTRGRNAPAPLASRPDREAAIVPTQ